MGMASEISLRPDERPLVGELETIGDARPGHGDEGRDGAIIRQLREQLKDRRQGNTSDTPPKRRKTDKPGELEDKYEPQRLARKICWQYDSTAHKVPLLRRHYI